MAKLLIGSIDLSKIDKSKVVTTDKYGNPFKNGAKYLNVSVWVNDQDDQYGNIASISIGGNDDRTYIGNLKEFRKDEQPKIQTVTDDDLPDFLK